MEKVTLSTSAVDPARSLAYWADEVLRHLDAELFDADARDFACRLVIRRTRGIAVARAELASYSGVWREQARSIGTADSVRMFRVQRGLLTLKSNDGEEYQVGPGEVFVTGPEAATRYSFAPVANGGTAIVADMTTVPLARLEEYTRFFPRDLARPLPRTATGMIIETYVAALSSSNTPSSEFMSLLNSFTELFAVAMGGYRADLRSQARDSIYYRALAYIRSHHANPQLAVERIAKALGVSERALFAAFDNKDCTPHKYINRVRIEAARLLLRQSDGMLNMIDVAMKCGFDSVSTFNRQFRAQTGISPSEYLAK